MSGRTGRLAEHLTKWPDAEFGPAHVILSDGNLDDVFIHNALAILDALLDGEPWPASASRLDPALYADCDPSELRATRTFLRDYLTVPVDEREREFGEQV